MSFYTQYGTLLVLAIAAPLLYAVIVTLNRLLRPNLPSPSKLTTYECGVDPEGTGWSHFNVRYYIFAFLFVVFDVESVFLFPWAVKLGELDATTVVTARFALVEMFIFVAILALGLLYAWRKGVLKWD